MSVKIDEKTKAAIESVLAKDQRVELIPTKNGIVIFQLSRKEIKGYEAHRKSGGDEGARKGGR